MGNNSGSDNSSNTGNPTFDTPIGTNPGQVDRGLAMAARQAERDKAIAQITERQERAQSGGFNPFEMGVLGAISNYTRNDMLDKLNNGGIPVFDERGNVVGAYNDRGRGYTGQTDYGPNRNQNNGGGDDNPAPQGPTPQQIALDKARSRRSSALATKQRELADAFNFFNEDYYNDMSASYRDFASSSLESAYDDSLRGIYQGFKARGMLSQGDVNQAIAGLDAAKQDELSRLDRLATDYATAKQTEVDTSRQKFGDELSALVGGATDEASINQQADNIENFDIAGRVDKLKKPGAKSAVEFFQGYDKVSQQNAAKQNVTASAAPGQVGDGGGSASSVVQMGANTAPSSMVGIRSPFQGSSTKVLGS